MGDSESYDEFSNYMTIATDAFFKLAKDSLKDQSITTYDEGVTSLIDYMNKFDGPNPFEYLARAGIFSTAFAFKAKFGFSLEDKPNNPIEMNQIIGASAGHQQWIDENREVLQVIVDACNHKFNLVENYMELSVNNSENGAEYLISFISVLVTFFLMADGQRLIP